MLSFTSLSNYNFPSNYLHIILYFMTIMMWRIFFPRMYLILYVPLLSIIYLYLYVFLRNSLGQLVIVD